MQAPEVCHEVHGGDAVDGVALNDPSVTAPWRRVLSEEVLD